MHVSGANASAAQVLNLLDRSAASQHVQPKQARAEAAEGAELQSAKHSEAHEHEAGKGQKIDIRA